MKEKDQQDPQQAPSEFAGFIRRIGIDAFDRFARQKVASKTAASKAGRPLHKLAELWLDLGPREKARFFDQVIAAGQAAAAAAPAMIAMASTRKARKTTEEPSQAEAPAADEKSEAKKKKKTKKADGSGKGKEKKEKKQTDKKKKKTPKKQKDDETR